MPSTRRVLFCLLVLLSVSTLASAQEKKYKAVAAAVERLRIAMVNGDSSALTPLISPHLSYGHSSGLVENHDEFIHKISTGISDFVTMDLSDQSIIVSGGTAIVRHNLDGEINDNGKKGNVHLKVMLVWENIKGKWRLLARQAIKAP